MYTVYEKLSKCRTGKLPANAKKVLCVETGKVFKSATSAASFVGCNQTSLSAACREEWRKVKGFHWKYLEVSN